MWEIEGPKSIASNITIKLKDFVLEESDNCKFDNVTIYHKILDENNWMTVSGKENRFCGRRSITQISIITGKLLVVFESDDINNNYRGFSGTYSIKPGN